MKQYKLVITTFAENDQYAAQLESYQAEMKRMNEDRYAYPSNRQFPESPVKWQEERSLEVTLTETEFRAVKLAAMEHFE